MSHFNELGALSDAQPHASLARRFSSSLADVEAASHPRTVKLSSAQRAELCRYRDHDRRPDVRERCSAVLKVEERKGEPVVT